jgi:hypothetical protein
VDWPAGMVLDAWSATRKLSSAATWLNGGLSIEVDLSRGRNMVDGVDLDLAERLGLPVDAGRIGAYGPNVTVLRDFVRSSRQPL